MHDRAEGACPRCLPMASPNVRDDNRGSPLSAPHRYYLSNEISPRCSSIRNTFSLRRLYFLSRMIFLRIASGDSRRCFFERALYWYRHLSPKSVRVPIMNCWLGVARHGKLPPRRHEELPPPWIT